MQGNLHPKKMRVKLLLSISIVICVHVSSTTSFQRYDGIFNFGDSISDTGNSLFLGDSAFELVANPPYGETFFGRPTGRCSDGRLIIDFIAEAFGLRLLPPYLSLTKGGRTTPESRIGSGANFAVAGATALDPEFFFSRKIAESMATNASLSVQMGWFKKFKSTLCATLEDCDEYLKKWLFVVGEIGGNDYNICLFRGRTIQQTQVLVPPVIEAISNSIIALIEEGALEVLVPGNFPLGCSAMYLTLFESRNKSDYDSFGCLRAFNAFAQLHNSQLKLSLDVLRLKYPHTKIVYADYYGATMQFVRAPERYGFDKKALFMVCCGGGGPHNFNSSAECGSFGATTCEDPSGYANWDGLHLTEAAYRIIASGLLYGPFTSPPLNPMSPSLKNFI